MSRIQSEIKHFSERNHVWWGLKTDAGQKRYDKRFQLFCQLCKPERGSTILEIGCGDGEFTKRLAKLPSSITAIDITSKLLQRAKNSLWFNKTKNIKLGVEDAEKLSFKNSSFDIVCGIAILHHLDIERALKEGFRLLKTGGQIFFSEPNLLNPFVFTELNINWLKKRLDVSPDETAFVRWNIEKLIRRVGFTSVVVKNYDFLFPAIPPFLIKTVGNFSDALEQVPLLKEFSGSLIIWGKK